MSADATTPAAAVQSPAAAQTEPSLSFDAMKLSEPVRRAVREVGYASPTPVQAAVFGPITDGRDVIVQSRTGSGKTAAFALPLIDRVVQQGKGVQALVLCPTRELALQVAGEVARLGKHQGVSVSAVYGGSSMEKQVAELAAGAEFVAGTPGRTLDHLRRGTLNVKGLKAIILDEADEMLSMGFAEELNAILEYVPKKRQGLLFSATMPESIQRLARRHLTEPEFITLSSDNVAPTDISHFVYFVGVGSRATELGRILEVEKPERAIVFCNTKDETVGVARELQRLGLAADYINGDLEQAARERALGAFRDGRLKYLVATDVAARGIDVSNVTHVVNYGFPEQAESYVHRTGRTGRAGRRGTAISLVGPQDVGNLYFLRLTYGIRPIERSLPSGREEHTRREMERVQMLREAFPAPPPDDALSLARRILSHDDGEVLVARLLAEFFQMAGREAVRSERPAAPSSPPATEGARSAGEGAPAAAAAPVTREERGPRRERDDRPRRARDDRPRDERPRDERPRRERSDEGAATRAASPAAPVVAGEEKPPLPATALDAASPAPSAPVPRRDRGARTSPERPRRIDVHHGDGLPALDDEGVEEGMDELRLAVGKRDGVRAGEIARLVREKGNIGRRDVGRIFVRDRFSLVSVRAELLEGVIEALKTESLNERPLSPERGRGASSVPPEAPAGGDA